MDIFFIFCLWENEDLIIHIMWKLNLMTG